jgi:hypothetical protein
MKNEKSNNDNQEKKKRTTRQEQQQQKNTLWELRNCRPRARHPARRSQGERERGGDGGVFSLCAHIRQVITRRRPLRTSSIHNNNEQRKKEQKKKGTHGIFIYNRESFSKRIQGGVVNRSFLLEETKEGRVI